MGANTTVSALGKAPPLALVLQRLDGGAYRMQSEPAALHCAIVKLLAQAAAWQRRRHMLLASGDMSAAAVARVRAVAVRTNAALAGLAAAASSKSPAAAERACDDLTALAVTDGINVPVAATSGVGHLVDLL